jgi:hypothetical protein
MDQQIGGDEMDCIADIGGELVFFELKDKEFSLGNAYSFGAKIGIIRPDYRIIATTERVANDAKEHFQRSEVAVRRRFDSDFYRPNSEPHAMRYIEGVNNLRPGLEGLITEINTEDVVRIASEVLPLATLAPEFLFSRFKI